VLQHFFWRWGHHQILSGGIFSAPLKSGVLIHTTRTLLASSKGSLPQTEKTTLHQQQRGWLQDTPFSPATH